MKKTALYLSMAALAITSLASCNEDPVAPPVPVPPVPGGYESVGDGAYDNPLNAWQLLLGYTDPAENEVWATGFIVGWINTDASPTFSLEAASACFYTPSGSNTNILISYELPWEVLRDEDGKVVTDEDGYPTYGTYVTDEATGEKTFVASQSQDPNDQTFIGGEDFWEKCATVQLPSGAVRDRVNLTNNPSNLGRQVTLKGTSGSKYCGAYGLRSASNYNWGSEGIYEEPQEPIPPMPAIQENATFKRVDTYEGEGQYLLVFDGNMMAGPLEPANYSYGYLPVKSVTPSGDEIVTSTLNAYMFYDVEGGVHIRDGYGRYVWWSTFTSFQLTENRGSEGMLWTVTPQTNGTFKIFNVEKNLWMQYSSKFSNVGGYNTNQGTLPALYKLVN